MEDFDSTNRPSREHSSSPMERDSKISFTLIFLILYRIYYAIQQSIHELSPLKIYEVGHQHISASFACFNHYIIAARLLWPEMVIGCFDKFCMHQSIQQKQKMQLRKIMVLDQTSEDCEEMSKKNNTSLSICGYVTLGVCQYLAEQEKLDESVLKNLSFFTLRPYIEKAMQTIAKTRRLQIKKFMMKMNESQKKSYLTDWVANFEISDYLDNISDKILNHNVYFFRQSAYDHPSALENLKFEEAERVKEEQEFKGQRYFYTSFNPVANKPKECFVEEIKRSNAEKSPVIIATDVLGHFNTTVLLDGRVYVLDSLPYVEGQYDDGILETISYSFKTSFLKE